MVDDTTTLSDAGNRMMVGSGEPLVRPQSLSDMLSKAPRIPFDGLHDRS
jgi:hypothetical protein